LLIFRCCHLIDDLDDVIDEENKEKHSDEYRNVSEDY
jgi:hypothetical protein